MLKDKKWAEAEKEKHAVFYRLWENEDFQMFLGEVESEVDALEKAGFVITEASANANTAQRKALELISADPPKNQEEQLRLYLQFRAVVGFWTRKRDRVKIASKKYDEANKLLQELGKQSGNIPQRRIAVR